MLKEFWMDVCDFFRGIKTFLFANALAVIGIMQLSAWQDIIPKDVLGYFNITVAVLILLFRHVTVGPASWRRIK